MPSAQKGVKDPLLPRGETNIGGRAQSFETSGPLGAPDRSSVGAPGRSKANEEWASELREADERARRFVKNLQQPVDVNEREIIDRHKISRARRVNRPAVAIDVEERFDRRRHASIAQFDARTAKQESEK